MSVTVYSAQVSGMNALPIAVEVDTTPGMHVFTIVGLADKEVQESRERIGSAIKNIGALAPHQKSQRVIINLAPAHIKKEGPAFDLPIALAYLLASGQIAFDPRKIVFLGELGLDGRIRRVPGVLPMAIAMRDNGFTTLVVPKGNGTEAALCARIRIIEMEHLADVVEFLSGRSDPPATPQTVITDDPSVHSVRLEDIRGQEGAKRALQIAAAGGHNLLLIGPPGTGKTLLAHALASILPPLSFDEILEVTKIYSIAGLLDEARPFVAARPLRKPHHTASHTSVIGGGKYPRPGEITLAHRGVLFLDELPEFDRRVIEALRQPLEERTVTVTRVEGVETFPAQFILVAAMNPCPCGYINSKIKDCVCTPGAVMRYTKKISGPLLDRMDMTIAVGHIDYEKLEAPPGTPSEEIRASVAQARKVQTERFAGQGTLLNSEMNLPTLRSVIRLDAPVQAIIKTAHGRWRLSARAYHRILKLSRTIADLDGSEKIGEQHMTEALQYRMQQE
ncbi:MAG: YifB family Mg chelatase-like AAA ATPase [Patescibacteria group bacterium]